MKQLTLLALATLLAAQIQAQDTRVLHIADTCGNAVLIPYADITRAHFTADSMLVTTPDTTLAIPTACVASFCGQRVDNPRTVSIRYSEGGTTYVNPLAHRGVKVTVDGGHVTIDNPITDSEITVSLSGSHTDGSLLYNADYKTTLRLDGLTLTSTRGAAIHIKCGKRIAVELPEGTVNTLADSPEGEQKAALYFKGHPEFEGSGTLNVTGNTRHAIASKEYLQLKKSTGTINILSAKGDGIHAGQYFQMNGGTLSIRNVADDGVQAETTDNMDDEQNGQLIVKGGTLDIQLTAQDVAGLKSDSLLTISGGEVTINATGDADKCIKSDTDLTVSGGTLRLTNNGNGATIEGDDETAKGLSADRDVMLLGGDITIKMTGTGGKGIKADGQYIQGDKETGEGPTLTVSTTGAKFSGSGNTGTQPGTNPWRPGGWRPGGNESSGSSSKAIKAMGTAYVYGGETSISTATSGAEGLESKKTVYIEGGRHYFRCYDDCINCSGNIYFDGGVTVCYSNGNDAVDSNAGKKGAITIGDGTVLAYTSKGSPEEGLDCDNNSYIQITGHGIAISAGGSQGGGGSSSTISGAAQGYNFVTSSISYATGRYYTLADADGQNLVTYSFEASVKSTLALFTATGMTKGSTYTVKYSTTAPTDATTEWHGLYLGSSAQGTTSVTSVTAK